MSDNPYVDCCSNSQEFKNFEKVKDFQLQIVRVLNSERGQCLPEALLEAYFDSVQILIDDYEALLLTTAGATAPTTGRSGATASNMMGSAARAWAFGFPASNDGAASN